MRQDTTAGRHIALVTELDYSFERELVRGIRHYAVGRGWQFHLFRPLDENIQAIRSFRPTGILLHPNWVFRHDVLRDFGVPVVCLFAEAPSVGLDNRECGRRQAGFFLDLGFRQFVYVGVQDDPSSPEREAGFREALMEAGLGYLPLRLKGAEYARRYVHQPRTTLPTRLLRLPRPVAAAAVDDPTAVEFMRLCAEAGLRVPDDIAVLGLDNDDLQCEIASPTLSSLAVPYREVGHKAAALLDRLLDGEPVPDAALLVAPSHVVIRQSTDVAVVQDAAVERSLRLIREFPGQALRLGDLADEAGVSARALTRRFQRATGRSPVHELRRLRLGQAMRLLDSTELPVKEVANRTGWPNARSLGRALRLATGMTPLAFRHWSRTGGGTP